VRGRTTSRIINNTLARTVSTRICSPRSSHAAEQRQGQVFLYDLPEVLPLDLPGLRQQAALDALAHHLAMQLSFHYLLLTMFGWRPVVYLIMSSFFR
jgi:hypothetical protein